MGDQPGPSRSSKTIFSLTEVTALQREKSDRVVTKVNPVVSLSRASSKVWSDFHFVYVDGVRQNFVQCQVCQTIMKHTTGHDGSGTSGMRHHLASHERKAAAEAASGSSQRSLKSMLAKAVPEGQVNATKRKLADAIALACARDMRPLSMCEGELTATVVLKMFVSDF